MTSNLFHRRVCTTLALLVGSACQTRPQTTSTARQVLTPSTVSSSNEPAPSVETQLPAVTIDGNGKLTAPANVQITHTDNFEAMDLTLDFSLTRDVARIVGRFVLPKGVELVSGQRERELGGFTNGQMGNMHVVVKVTAPGTYVLAGGIDLYVSEGIKLHKSAAVRVQKHVQ